MKCWIHLILALALGLAICFVLELVEERASEAGFVAAGPAARSNPAAR